MTRRLVKTAHDPGDSQITSHCPFCGSGQVVGRSDGNIECEFCGMTYLVRIQPMFTGMPQQPMPPGAGFGGETSMATDLQAPGMIGPDGLPLDPAISDPILAEEEGAGGVPFGAEGEEGEEDEFGGIPESGPAETEGSDGGFPPEEGEEGFPPGEEGEEGDGDDGAPPWVKDKGSSPEKSGDKGKGDKKDKSKGKKGGGDKKAPPFEKKSAQQQIQRTLRPQRSRYGDDEIAGSSGGMCSCKGCPGHPGRQCYAQVLQAGSECYGCRHQDKKNVQAEARFRTVAGDWLPESAYIRHLAALHGGVEVLRRPA